jgi:RNA polymerase sigma factor (sigma-70 family)
MATAPLNSVLQHFRTLAADDCSDQELVQRYAATADAAAFTTLVRRHGSLVHGVCRRVLGAGPDLDDAFQATFVVLLKKVASIRKQASIASWLYGVAFRLARDLKSKRQRRQAGTNLDDMAGRQPMHDDPLARAELRELGAVLDEELQRLPAWSRDALVACHLQGMSYAEAAEHLSWPLGTLKTRLGRARNLLRQRLERRGVGLSVLALCVAISDRAKAAVPAPLLQATLRCVSPQAVPARVLVLAEGALQTLGVSKPKAVVTGLGAVSLMALAVGTLAWQAPAATKSDAATAAVAAMPVAETSVQQPNTIVKADDQAPASAEDEQKFRATLKITDQALLDFFRNLTLSDTEVARIHRLIEQLDAPAFKDRDKATAALIAEGVRVLPLLKNADAHATLERRLRLERCLKAIDKADWSDTVAAAARLVKGRRPEGGAVVLLSFIPFAEVEAVDDVLDALCRLAVLDGKVQAPVLAALKDPIVARRAAGAVLVGAFGTAEQRRAVAPLLDDADTRVRFRAAQGLLAAHDRQAISTLIDVLASGELAWAERAEGLLLELADSSASKVVVGDKNTTTQACRAAWQQWGRQHQDKVELTAANSGLQFGNGPATAKKAATNFVNALIKQDVAQFERYTAVPFNIDGVKTLTTRQELNEFCSKSKVTNDQFSFTIVRVVSVAEQLRISTLDGDQEYLAGLPRHGTWVVHVEANENGRIEPAALIVRTSGAVGRVIGVVEGTRKVPAKAP